MDKPGRAHLWTPEIQQWELDLCKVVAKRFERREPDELEAELAKHLLHLKRSPPAAIRNWTALLKSALYNKARNWLRSRREEQTRTPRFSEGTDDLGADWLFEEVIRSEESDPDQQAGLAQLWEALDPELQTTWLALHETGGNHTRAAEILGIHRNTVRAHVRKIEDLAMSHGYDLKSGSRKTPRRSVSRSARTHLYVRRREAVVLHARFLRNLLRLRLSGSQWRLLVWLILRIQRRKRARVFVNWPAIAKALSIGRATAWRASRALVRRNILITHGRDIGLRRDMARP